MAVLNPQLVQLKRWAEQQAVNDPDETARPLWAQIAAEVSAYFDETPIAQDGPDLFEVAP